MLIPLRLPLAPSSKPVKETFPAAYSLVSKPINNAETGELSAPSMHSAITYHYKQTESCYFNQFTDFTPKHMIFPLNVNN